MAGLLDDLEGKGEGEDKGEPKGDEPKPKKGGILGKIDSSKHKTLIQIGIGLAALIVAYMTYKAMKNAQANASTTAATTTTPSTTSTDTGTGDGGGYGGGGGYYGSGSGTDTSSSDLTNLENQLSTLTASDTAFQSTQASEMAALQASQASQMATITQQSQSKETQIQALTKQIAALKNAATVTGKKQTTTTQAGQSTAAQAAKTQTLGSGTSGKATGQAGVEPSLSTHAPAAAAKITTHPGGVQGSGLKNSGL
jgi:hypothetical protein